MTGINWYVFTKEEEQALRAAISRGDRENLACCIEGVNFDLEKEAEIQKISDQMLPEDDGFVSDVEDEVSKEFLEGINDTEKTPEIEEEFQQKLDEERKEFVEKKKATKKSKKSKESEAVEVEGEEK